MVDPRAGHGPGIGGMKQDSEIGVALAAGHACYFVGFLPKPMPGQTIEDVCRAEAIFVEEVAARHPDAEGKPIVIANCQAGWQVMMMAAINPNRTGPIMLAGSPLSYWAGVHGKNPMRYLGGMLGGTWLTALSGDLGNGIFDGANLVANFESMNPANTYWSKAYNVYSKVDTESQRFLDFETWWGSPVLLNAGEMQWIADNLFVGNKLATGQIRTSDGIRIDLRNITAPIIVFCSWGDNITPPQQALDWVLDLYDSDREMVANGQTIIYTMHQDIGHLGIFVSGKVATKEHGEFVTLHGDDRRAAARALRGGHHRGGRENHQSRAGGGQVPVPARGAHAERHPRAGRQRRGGRCAVRHGGACVGDQPRAIPDHRRPGRARHGDRAIRRSACARLHPNRLRFAVFSDRNPFMQPVKALAESVRAARQAGQCRQSAAGDGAARHRRGSHVPGGIRRVP